MLEFICGKKGSGKTRRMVEMANTLSEETNGRIIFVDDNNDRIFDLKHAIRLVMANEFDINSPDALYGFIQGMIAGDFDINTVFIDSFLSILNKPVFELIGLFQKLDKMSSKHNVKLIVSLSGDIDTMPEYVKQKAMN